MSTYPDTDGDTESRAGPGCAQSHSEWASLRAKDVQRYDADLEGVFQRPLRLPGLGDREGAWMVKLHSLPEKASDTPTLTPTPSRPLAIRVEKQKPDEMQMPPIPDFRTSALNGAFTLRVLETACPFPSLD